MPSPVTPTTFCAAVPEPNSDFCTRFTRFLSIAQYLCDFFSWFLNGDGSISTEVTTELSATLLPPGTIISAATNNLGSGWLLADGSQVSRTTYANLFTAIGTRYGVGDGSTTFTLPDFRGRSAIGAGAGSQGGVLTNRDINTKYVGEEDHTMTEDELVPHTHTFDGPIDRNAIRATSVNQTCWRGTVDEETDSTGGGTPFNVIHPCFIAFVFIKT